MKNVVVLLLMTLISSATIAGENPKDLYKEINRKVYLDLSQIELDAQQKNYVEVQFKVVDSVIKVINVNGSMPKLESMITEELSKMNISSDCDEEIVHNYRFTFERE